MKTQEIDSNELGRCIIYWDSLELLRIEEILDKGSTTEMFCRGTGTVSNGMTFQQFVNDNTQGDFTDAFMEMIGNDLVEQNIIILENDSYIVNPIMKNQEIVVGNELSKCVSYFQRFMFGEGDTAETYCGGTGILFNGYGISGSFQELLDSGFFEKENMIEDMKSLNIIIGKNLLLDTNMKYFEFEIDGINNYEDKDIQYEIVLNNTEYNGEDKETRNQRIENRFLKFALVKIVDGKNNLIFHNRSYEDLTETTIYTDSISSSDGEINQTYRLYMWIGDEVVIGGGDAIYDYDMETWSDKLYASVRVDVNADFIPKNELEVDYVPATNSASFKRLATNKEDVVVDTDGTVYLSGTNEEVNYNYVWYSGKLWRITAIYPDGTMKMITDNAITTIRYGSERNFYTDEENSSYVYQWLNEDFLDTLYNYENIIVTNFKWNVSPGNEIISSKLPIEGHNEVVVTAPVGLLNSYEYYTSYRNTIDDLGYLNIGYGWWLLNRYSTSSTGSPLVWGVDYSGEAQRSNTNNADGIRPVVNLKSTIELEGGNGTISNPYKIKGDKGQVEPNTTLLNTRSSGEYVKFNEELYRIVGVENETTKLIKADYIKDGATILTKEFANSITFGSSIETGSDDYWDYYLNNTWLKSVDSTYDETNGTSNMLVKGTYYLGNVPYEDENYKLSICASASNVVTTKECEKTTSIWNGFVGLPRYGEMFATQTRDYTSSNATGIWLITPNDSSFVGNVFIYGSASGDYPSSTYGARPTIHLKDTIVIKSGEGTKDKPFVVGLPD